MTDLITDFSIGGLFFAGLSYQSSKLTLYLSEIEGRQDCATRGHGEVIARQRGH